MKLPTVSVLIPTYNFARYLPEAIESVLAQDFQDFELVIVDDASRDNSAEIIRSYTQRDPRIRFQVNSPNVGMVQNWNLCLDLARGEYVKFLFGDDKFCRPDALGELVRLMERNPAVSLAVSARQLMDEHSKPIGLWKYPGRSGVRKGTEVIARCLVDARNQIGEPSAVLFRRADAGRKFDTRYRQIVDLEFWFHLLEKGDLAFTEEPLCAFRVHSAQQTAVNRADKAGEKEQHLLVEEFFAKPYFSLSQKRRIGFSAVYHFRKNGKNAPATELEQRIYREIGWQWYFFYWLHRRVTRPFYNLAEWSVRQRARVTS